MLNKQKIKYELETIGNICDTITDYVAAGSFKDLADHVKYLSDPDYGLLVRTKDIKNDFKDEKLIYINEDAFNYLWRVNLNKDSLILPNIGNCGEVHYIDCKKLPYNNCALGPNAILVRSNTCNLKYLYYVLQTPFFQDQLMKITSPVGQRKFNKTDLKKLLVPVPSVEDQERIVDYLEKFEEMIKLKEDELSKRKQQYNYISNKLLINDKYSSDKIESLFNISKGKTPIQKSIPGEYPLVVTTSERKSSNDYQFDSKAVCIPLVSSRGHGIASLNHVYYQEGKFALGNILCALESKNEDIISAKYLYYYFESTKNYTLVPLMKGGANVSLHMNDILSINIKYPSLEKQNTIIQKLDALIEYDSILSREIELRRKQYEYYRNKLLSFEELSVSE